LAKRFEYIDVKEVATLMTFPRGIGPNSIYFANYITNARIVPFESSPLGAESLSSICAAAHKGGSIGVGTYIGIIAAGSHGAFLLVTVPLGIVICGLSVSLARWLEENRKRIWERLIMPAEPAHWAGPDTLLYGEKEPMNTVPPPAPRRKSASKEEGRGRSES
jgi:hypothetical protein